MHVSHALRMASLQIRDVPEEVHRVLRVRAAAAGMSLSEYALAELMESTRRPTLDEIASRVRALPPVHVGDAPVTIIREHRDA